MNYFEKYLKYKMKYFELLNKMNVSGGMAERAIETGQITTFLFKYYKVDKWDDLFIEIKNDHKLNIEQKSNLLVFSDLSNLFDLTSSQFTFLFIPCLII